MNIQSDKLYSLFLEHPAICTDSRRISNNCLFFALRGVQFNGNSFSGEALEKGAAFAIIDDPEYLINEQCIMVPNVLDALWNIAIIHRKNLKATVLGISGTNGKTTTKELIWRVLSEKYSTCLTQGNLNNHIGVPLTILSMNQRTEMAVVEIGANHPGEITDLCHIARPDFGIITNIGKAHLEGFGSFEGVIRAKSELYCFIESQGGKVFVNLDNKLLDELTAGMERITYGTSPICRIQGRQDEDSTCVRLHWKDGLQWELIQSNLFGSYNFENILSAICVGDYFGVKAPEIRRAIESYTPENNRSQVYFSPRNKLILDAYNANPSSMIAALKNFVELKDPRKLVILGDMMELGKDSIPEHQGILKFLEENGPPEKILIGPVFSELKITPECKQFRDVSEAKRWLGNNPLAGYTILIKGSRAIRLEELTDVL
jgi:UDP-N-acetylmuramoyl-tripeptide--D-alanyl-D-alanine ligase